jgi:hypothetical protein
MSSGGDPANTPTVRTLDGTAAETARATSTVSRRGEPATKLSPTASAPAAATIRASAGDVTPQTFTRNRRSFMPPSRWPPRGGGTSGATARRGAVSPIGKVYAARGRCRNTGPLVDT